MKYLSRYILNTVQITVMAVLVAAMASCRSEAPEIPNIQESQDALTITGSINIPDMQVSMTRGVFGDSPKENLKLTVLEFDKGADASQSFITNVYNAELTSTSGVGNEQTVSFKFTVKASTSPKILHLMVADDFLTTAYGSEASIIPSLSVGRPGTQREAYWGYVEFPDGLTTVDEYGNPILRDDVKKKLEDVPVIRNFAKITVSENLTNFDLLGFELVNVPTSGTVAPWDQVGLSIPDLLNGSTMKDYAAITNTSKYSGIIPGGTQFSNTEAEARSWTAAPNSPLRSTAARFLYEHPYESTRRTYIIVNGQYRPDATSAWQQGFYKIDLGKTNTANGTFDYYNIIRNIQYNVVITEVSAPGSATVADAITRAPFNNLMAATETASMLNVSDGKNMLVVNDTNHIIVDENETVDILYRYIENVTGTSTENNNFEGLHTVRLEPGEVIKSVGPKQTFTNATGNWVKYTITPNAPTDVVKTQDFSIVDGQGLGRTIHLVLRKPWQYVPIGTQTALVKSGSSDTYTSTESDVISTAAGAPLTVYFNLPDGLPESMFPLEFQLEAKNQGIENNKIGTLVVTSGPSLFDPNRIAISYIKTVSYAEYLYNYVTGDTSNDVDVNSPNTNHTVRCRFLTITATADNDAKIMIHNPYFSPNASVKFTRN